MDKTLAVVIVSWNTKELLKRCLLSLKRYGLGSKMSVWVVDNASSDGSADLVRKNFPNVTLIANSQNLGFAKANNQVVKNINEPYILLLNADTKITKNSLESLLKCLVSEEKIAACGPRLIGLDSQLQHQGFYRRLPSLLQAVLFYTDLHRLAIKIPFFVRSFWESEIERNEISQVDQIPGACLLIKKQVLEQVGYFDETYPLWFEDVDLCTKIRQKGYLLMYVPTSRVIHIGGASFDRWQDQAKKETRFWRSLFHYFDLNKNILERILIRVIIFYNLIFLISSRFVMQKFSYKPDRQRFIHLKKEIINLLLKEKEELPWI